MVNLSVLLKILRLTILWSGFSVSATAGEVTVAVASNFLTTAQKISRDFQKETGHQVHLVNGSTGTLYAQIVNGAPYDVFLSADQARVLLLAKANKLHQQTHKPYALGRLVLFTPKVDIPLTDIASSLAADTTHHFAMADPALAPYGRAAREVLDDLGISDEVRQKSVLGSNIGQTFGFVQTGNAPFGFVAYSQVISTGGTGGAWLDISPHAYTPIIQEAGLLARAAENPAAIAFYDHLSSPTVTSLLPALGYRVPQ